MKNWITKSKKLFAAIALGIAGLAGCQSAAADTLTITTGGSGGTYHNVLGNNLGNTLSEQGLAVELITSSGSVQNLERLAAGEADIGFAQADAFAHWSRSRVGSDVQIIGTLGQECVFMATHEDGISRERDLGAQGVKVAVGERGTGSAVTWQYMQSLNENYRAASTYFQGGVMALAQVKTRQMDAFMWVTSPENRNHRFFEAVMASGSEMQLIDVDARSLRGKLPNGEDVYTMQDVTISEGWVRDTKVRVPCTSVLVVANTAMESSSLEEVATAIMMNGNRIRGL